MNCKIVGYEFKTLEVKLSPGEDFYGEVGSMVCIEDGIVRSLNVVKTKKSFARYLSGESIFIVHYKNNSFCEKKLLLSCGLLGLHPIKLIKGYPILLRCGGYVASTNNVDIGLSIQGFGLKAGMSFQRIEGDATIFVETAGTPIEIDLKIGESIEVDENHIIALSGFDQNSISSKWQIKNIFHGEGLSTSFIRGPGRLIISPSPLPNTKDPVQKLWGCFFALLFFTIITGISLILVLI